MNNNDKNSNKWVVLQDIYKHILVRWKVIVYSTMNKRHIWSSH